MKELRFDWMNGVWRIAFAFDPRREAILLVGGDKRGAEKPILGDFVVAGNRGRIQTYDFLFEVIDRYRAAAQICLNFLPNVQVTQMPQQYGQSIIGEICITDLQPGDAFQSVMGITDPVANSHFAMVTLRDNVGQPYNRDPSPSKPLMEPMPWNMLVKDFANTHPSDKID